MADDFAFHHIDDQFGHIGGVIGNTLTVETVLRPHLKDHIEARRYKQTGQHASNLQQRKNHFELKIGLSQTGKEKT
jgi:hypothetical protein